ncbi:hypothetical protein NDU88_005112 [Pleurodeles waltl]|uniref:Uncharacterized protein n=1 Tax=Pleurodeles waltl TaxID=8319 RepID=A0AAV7WCE9_PLEWA|nr:hypothetical protein NDU88_005112 [Pleurodeles waltl]
MSKPAWAEPHCSSLRSPTQHRASEQALRQESPPQGAPPAPARDSPPVGPRLPTSDAAPPPPRPANRSTHLRGRAGILTRPKRRVGRIPLFSLFWVRSAQEWVPREGSHRQARVPDAMLVAWPQGRPSFKQPQGCCCTRFHSFLGSVDRRTSRGSRKCGAEPGIAIISGG